MTFKTTWLELTCIEYLGFDLASILVFGICPSLLTACPRREWSDTKCINGYEWLLVLISLLFKILSHYKLLSVLAGGYNLQLRFMGGTAGTAGMAVAVPLLREVRQNKILPYHIIV